MSPPAASEQIPLLRLLSNASKGSGSRPKVLEGEVWDTLFLEDTCELKDSPGTIGVVAKTWHDIDDLDNWEEIDECIPGKYATDEEVLEFRSTGQPPRHYLLLTPSSPTRPPMLLHESELTLLDRALAFGDVVKRNLTSPLSGTIISVSTSVGLRHSFMDPNEPAEASGYVSSVLEEELMLSNEWNDGDFVIYKNCWMGVVEDVYDDVAVRLENGSVVVVENPFGLEIPILSEEEEAQVQNISSLMNGVGDTKGDLKPVGTTGRKSTRPKTIPSPSHLSPGQTVTTTKANLRRGRWLYGAYNASISPTGVVVNVNTIKIGVNWLCQNMMVSGRFVAVEKPDAFIETENEISKLRKFRKSTGGFVGIDGKPFTGINATGGGGELQVGDRVRFRDLEAAVEKYQGTVRKIPRSDTMGFEVNTFVVVESKTRVRVLWQDMTESIEEARGLVPYLNVDEHEVWPGEMVVIKSESEDATIKPTEAEPDTTGRQQFEGAWQLFNDALAAPAEAIPAPEFIKPEKVGVIQTVNPAERVAKVVWFSDPKVEVAGNIMIPGSKTGPLGENIEDVSFYEVIAHQALGVRRGDFVLVAPERIVSEEQQAEVIIAGNDDTMDLSANPQPTVGDGSQWQQMAESLRGMVDGGLLANLSAALGTSSHPQLQAVSRMLNQLPLINGQSENRDTPAAGPITQPVGEDAYLDQPLDWVGEIVDLGLDGLVTVRLGALDEPKDVKVSIERVHIIFNDEMDLDGFIDEDDEDDEDDEYDSEESGSEEFDEDDEDDGWMDEDLVIDEQVYYQGGERIANDGGEEAWSTDEEVEDMDLEDYDSPPPLVSADTDEDTMMANIEPEKETKKEEPKDDKVMQPPQIPENMPAPEAFALPTSSNQPARFVVLGSNVPIDHAFGTQPATPLEPTFLRRVNKEYQILSSSLPDGILVRSWESRMDLLRVLIIGPLNTPYELAPFVFDFHFSRTFPQTPPLAHFHSWTGGVGRVNPNLYEDGKICLSLLGTWHAERRNEGWSAGGSSVLQVLVSLMGLVLVREPYYNEAGFGVYVGAKEAALNSTLYSEKAYILARGFIKRVLQRPVQGFEDEIKWLYLPGHTEGPELLKEVIKRAKDVVGRSSAPKKDRIDGKEPEVGSEGVGRVSAGAIVLLKRHLEAFEGILEGAEKVGVSLEPE